MKPINSLPMSARSSKFEFVEISDASAASIDGGMAACAAIRSAIGRRRLIYKFAATTDRSISPQDPVILGMRRAVAIASGDNASAKVSVASGGDTPIELYTGEIFSDGEYPLEISVGQSI